MFFVVFYKEYSLYYCGKNNWRINMDWVTKNILLSLFCVFVASVSADDRVSINSGDWAVCGIWGESPSEGFCNPSSNSNHFISNNNTVNINKDVIAGYLTSANLTIDQGAILNINESFNYSQTEQSNLIDISGTLNIDQSSSVNFRTASLTVKEGGVINISSGELVINRVTVESGGIINLTGGGI
jgi:hypothetical protein